MDLEKERKRQRDRWESSSESSEASESSTPQSPSSLLSPLLARENVYNTGSNDYSGSRRNILPTTNEAPQHEELLKSVNETPASTKIIKTNTLLDDTTHNVLKDECRSVYDSYERLERINEGTYGIVWKARDLSTNEIVALKQIKFESYDSNGSSGSGDRRRRKDYTGFPLAALRELNVLLSLSHESIISVREVVLGSTMDKLFMVMEVGC